MENLTPIIIAGFAMFGSPGPAIVSVAATGAAFGFRAGLRYLAGIIIGTLLVAVIVLSGIAGVIFVSPGARPVISVLAIGYIVYLAFRIATAPPIQIGQHAQHAPRFISGVALALANPKAYAGIGAVFSGHTIVPDLFVLDVASKVGLLAAIILITDPIWLFVGTSLARVFAEPGMSRVLNVAMAIALLAAVGLTIPALVSG